MRKRYTYSDNEPTRLAFFVDAVTFGFGFSVGFGIFAAAILAALTLFNR